MPDNVIGKSDYDMHMVVLSRSVSFEFLEKFYLKFYFAVTW